MIPDTLTGAAILTVVNMTVVFLVLIMLAVVIVLIHKIVSGSEESFGKGHGGEALDEEVSRVSLVDDGSGFEEDIEIEEVQDLDTLDPKRKAAIFAAVYAYTGRSEVPVFVRRVSDSGEWGKTSRWIAMNE